MIKSTDAEEQRFGRGVLTLLGWAFGILFMLSGVISLFNNFFNGLALLLLGVDIFPPFWRYLEKKFHVKNVGWLSVIAFVVLVVLFGATAK